MKNTNIAFAVLAIIALCLPSFAQSRRIGNGSASAGTDKFAFYFETHLDPGTPELANVDEGTISADDGIVHRYVVDRARRVYFGYDVTAEELPEPNTYRAIFSQLTIPPKMVQSVLSDNPSNWTPLPTPGWGSPSPRTIRAGEVVVLNLLTNNATGQKIVDYVTIQEPPRAKPVTFGNVNLPPREFAYAPGSPRDFRADDGALKIRAPRLSINGKLDPSTKVNNLEVSGQVVWIYVGNHGRFVLSLTPHPELGFRKAGEVRGSTLTFTDGPDTFNLVAGSAIAPTQAAFNLYVFHDPTWKPTYPFANLSAFNMGVADRAESLIRK